MRIQSQVSIVLLLGVAACGASEVRQTSTPVALPRIIRCAATSNCVSTSIGEMGAQLFASDDSASLYVPPGAFEEPTAVEIGTEPVPRSFSLPPGASPVGPLVRTAAGGPFLKRVDLNFGFDPSKLAGLCTNHGALAAATDVAVITSPDGSAGTWTLIESTVTTTVSVSTTKLQYFLPVIITYEIDPNAYGFGVGSVFPDLELTGGAVLNTAVPATTDSTDPTTWQPTVSFEWLHNQACKGYRYAYIDVSTVWCPRSGREARDLTQSYSTPWRSSGGLIFSVLEQGSRSDQPPTTEDLVQWINLYDSAYPIALDQQDKIVKAASIQAWPTVFFVRLSDMRVQNSFIGVDDTVYQAFTDLLSTCDIDAGTGCPSTQTCNASGMCQ